MPRITAAEMAFSKVYSALIAKAERKKRTRAEVDEVTSWLTGYTAKQLEELRESDITYAQFFADCPAYNPRSELITGKICGVRVEEVTDPFMKKVRQLDKLVDELAQGKAIEDVLR